MDEYARFGNFEAGLILFLIGTPLGFGHSISNEFYVYDRGRQNFAQSKNKRKHVAAAAAGCKASWGADKKQYQSATGSPARTQRCAPPAWRSDGLSGRGLWHVCHYSSIGGMNFFF